MSGVVTGACAVRPARAEDAVEIARLSQLLGPWDPQAVMAHFDVLLGRTTHACFVADDGKTLRGFISAEHRLLLQAGERIELIALAVDASSRRRGIAGRLVAAVEDWALRRGVSDMVVRSSLSRDASHAFYRERGYALHKTQHIYTRSLRP